MTSNTGTHYVYSTFTPDKIPSSEKDAEHPFNKEFSSSNPLQEQNTKPQSSRIPLCELLNPRDYTGINSRMSYILFDSITLSSAVLIAWFIFLNPQPLGLWTSVFAMLGCIVLYFIGHTFFYRGNMNYVYRKTACFALVTLGLLVWVIVLSEYGGFKAKQQKWDWIGTWWGWIWIMEADLRWNVRITRRNLCISVIDKTPSSL